MSTDNQFLKLFQTVYQNTSPVPPQFRTRCEAQRTKVIFRHCDPELNIYLSSKDRSGTSLICVELPGKFRTGIIEIPWNQVADDYRLVFNQDPPSDWKTRDLCMTNYLGNIRQIVEEEGLAKPEQKSEV